ncbi:permease-like cell division protein FtsX [Olsenella sp. HMSC062G07]|uniref:permease-like cell division protein FtsX n=1 Tax=Olsenella sp. HMSC062G07 TaxID=1739330 RepID=UPI0008A21615|nr:permease-like cell division protein FtsX [Olsenella sp. HMSC062G07]OFK24981.1 cell division protein [Olsenella sp. HMSC062G07]
MVPSNLGYSLHEAGRHFRRNWSTVMGAIVTIFLSLFVIGLFAVGSVLLNRIAGNVEDQVTIQAFLSDGANKASVDAFQQKVQGWEYVQGVTYKSKEEALESYKQKMSNKNASDVVAALDGDNPLPASLVITLSDPSKVESVAGNLTADADFKGIADDANDPSQSVQYGRETVKKLLSVTYYLRVGTVVLVALLAFIAFVFINNTIRLAISARRREIAIMRLVGASNGFIRGPFLAEGMLESLIGSLLAIAVLQAGVSIVLPRLQAGLTFLSFDVPVSMLVLTYAALVAIGCLLGLFGSAIAMRRYLKV